MGKRYYDPNIGRWLQQDSFDQTGDQTEGNRSWPTEMRRRDTLDGGTRARPTYGEMSGDYLVDDVLDDGRVVLRPDTSADAIGLEPVTDEEFEQTFGHLPSDGEG
jgi:hypothetical protein